VLRPLLLVLSPLPSRLLLLVQPSSLCLLLLVQLLPLLHRCWASHCRCICRRHQGS
jgi:hypothetical protein